VARRSPLFNRRRHPATGPAPASVRAAMMLAIAVPVPRQSASPRPEPATMSVPTEVRRLSAGRLASTPESTTATMTPAPRLLLHAWSGASRNAAHWLVPPVEFAIPAQPLDGVAGGGPAGSCVGVGVGAGAAVWRHSAGSSGPEYP
jgi:hypothetical protein